MFEWIHKQGVKSDKGFIFESAHRFYFHYSEGEHVLRVVVEGGRDDNDNHLLLVDDDFKKRKWEAPHDKEEISGDKLKEIKQNICDALEFMDINYKFTRL